ncbi:MAG: flagellar protein FliS [Pseudomonadota bacterium]|nr:flagellar protein FliS [Pseudomonadota bacterium]MEC8128577.1 flagellar protein FliS [Pseudomonadota bacterium]MEC8672322.1 flagellar protein FliS [Pseudomonadota bacterium]|tara:strand:- start:286 stop:696 length:411 start_codon:yes stop_codon:yes gene_type:complete
MATKKILNAYKNANREAVAESDDPQALIMILLDELLRAMRGYVTLLDKENNDETRKSDHFTRSLTMLYGLQSCLNFDEGGEIAENLFRLYEYARVQLLNTSRTGEIEGTQTAINAVTEIREAWSSMDPKAEIQNVG